MEHAFGVVFWQSAHHLSASLFCLLAFFLSLLPFPLPSIVITFSSLSINSFLSSPFSPHPSQLGWSGEMKALLASDELAKDVEGAEALLERHEERKQEVRNKQEKWVECSVQTDRQTDRHTDTHIDAHMWSWQTEALSMFINIANWRNRQQ